MCATPSGDTTQADSLTTAGIAHALAGRLEAALDCFGQALAVTPDHALALHGVGLLALRSGPLERAATFLARAAHAGDVQLAARPAALATIYADLGAAYYASARLPEAIEAWGLSLRQVADRRVLGSREAAIDRLIRSADEHRERGEDAAAVRLYQMAAIARPASARALRSVAEVYLEHGNPREAEAPLREAVRREDQGDDIRALAVCLASLAKHEEAVALLEPLRRRRSKDLNVRLALADSLVALGRLPAADRLLRRSLAGRPRNAHILWRLGEVAGLRGRAAEAGELLDLAIVLDPGYRSRLAFGEFLLALGRYDEAVTIYDALLKDAPNDWRVHVGRGRVLDALGLTDPALRSFARAVQIAPSDPGAGVAFADALAAAGASDAARDRLQDLVARHPGDGALRIRHATFLPPISAADAGTNPIRDALATLGAEPPPYTLAQARSLRAPGPLLLHEPRGIDPPASKSLRTALARLHLAACPELAYVAPHVGRRAARRRLRIGICSSFLGADPIGLRWRGHFAHIDRARFEIVAIRPPAALPIAGEAAIDRLATATLRLPQSLAASQAALADLELDVLVYPTLGRDHLPYLLGFARLAPVQCASWDDPVSTGIPAIDYFLSSALLERDEADADYSERLVRLPCLPAMPARAGPAAPIDRESFGFPAHVRLYLCPQDLTTIAPEFDAWIGELLRADPAGRVAFVDRAYPSAGKVLLERLERTLPDVAWKIRMLEHAEGEPLQSLIAAADAVLDPIRVSGCHASFSALGLGVPVITAPGPGLRTRRTLGMYREIGLTDFVCAERTDYAAAALHVAQDRDYRDRAVAAIRAGCARLFEPERAVRAFEQFCEEACARAAAA